MKDATSELLRWFRSNRRDLPWRRDRTPYRVLVSEVMLQQTTVAAATPYFERFVAELPTFEALAAAPAERVLELWSGLGYYRRARLISQTARAVVERHAGVFPRDREAALALPGIGPYTAGAVLSIAHGLAEPAVDGNVARVLSRWTARPLRAERGVERRELERIASSLQAHGPPGDVTESLMELGATVCTPRAPSCGTCPLSVTCCAVAQDVVSRLPPARARPASREVAVDALVAIRGGRFLLRRRSDEATLMASMWELPSDEIEGPARGARGLLRQLGGGRSGAVLGEVRHVVTTRRVTMRVVACELRAPPRSGGALRWIRPHEALQLALTGATRRALPLVQGALAGA